MNADIPPNSVNLISLNYQEEPRSLTPLPQNLRLIVGLNAFPKSVPVSFRSLRGFEALQVFAEDGWVFVSRCWDDGATDDWGRAVLSARAVAMTEAAWEQWGRDALVLHELLAHDDCRFPNLDSFARTLNQALNDRSILLSQQRFATAVTATKVSRDVLARALLACVASDNAVIHLERAEACPQVLRLALAFMPTGRLRRTRISTSCDDVHALDREPIVFVHTRAPQPSLRQRISRFIARGRVRPGQLCEVDLARPRVPLLRCRHWSLRLFVAALNEMIEGPDAPGLEFGHRHRALAKYIEYRQTHGPLAGPNGVDTWGLPPQAGDWIMAYQARAECC